MPFKHDSRGIEAIGGATLLIPDGWYTLKIIEAEELRSKSGNDMVKIVCKPVNDPDYQDATIWHYVVFIPKGQKGDGINVYFRKCIGVAYGGDDIVDASDWVGRKFKGYVTKDTYEGKDKNKIIKVESLEENSRSSDDVPF